MAKKYRTFYSTATGIVVPKDFEVHHIDFNRENNDINNLVALPKKLHNQYHFFMPQTNTISLKLCHDFNGSYANNYNINQLISFLITYRECLKWINFRNYLLGIEDNIYKLSYEYRTDN